MKLITIFIFTLFIKFDLLVTIIFRLSGLLTMKFLQGHDEFKIILCQAKIKSNEKSTA
jgi:hypothetical protein